MAEPCFVTAGTIPAGAHMVANHCGTPEVRVRPPVGTPGTCSEFLRAAKWQYCQ
jgi:hypothetical protein